MISLENMGKTLGFLYIIDLGIPWISLKNIEHHMISIMISYDFLKIDENAGESRDINDLSMGIMGYKWE